MNFLSIENFLVLRLKKALEQTAVPVATSGR